MNILYLTNHLNIGGISSYVFTLGKGLKAKGHNIYIASSGGEMLNAFMREGINYIRIPIKTKKEVSPKILASFFKLLGVIKQEKIDVIHSNTRVTQVLGCLLQRFSGKPHISTCHGFFKRRISRLVFPCWGYKVIAISDAVREHLEHDFKVAPDRIKLINSGLDVDRFRVQGSDYRIQKKKELGIGGYPAVGIVARLSEEKGHICLIQAMKKVLEKIPGTQLLIVGDGKMKNKLLKLVKSLGLENKILFLSSVADTMQILPVLDIFVLPSSKEGLGLSLMEAMAAGLGVIGSDIGGIKSLIKDGKTGLLVKPNDSVGLSSAIISLLQDEEKRKALGVNAREFIAHNFSAEKMISDTQELYLECQNVKL